MALAVLLARQRSGTGALGSILDQHEEIDYFGEVFHDGEIGSPRNYFTFLERKIKQEPARGLPMAARRNFEEYLAYLEGLTETPFKLIDVKYRSTHHFNGPWSGRFDEPVFLRWIKEKGLPVIHLTRRNLLKTYVSGLLADANRVWHATEKDELKVKTIRLDPAKTLANLNASAREVEAFFGSMRRYSKVTTFDYDEMLDKDGKLGSRIEDCIRRILPVKPFEKRTPAFVKQVDDRLWKVIENYEEVADTLAPTQHAWMPYS